MVSEKNLFSGRYKFKHIQLDVVESDKDGNVLVFSAKLVTTKLPGQLLSEGLIEINRTLWKEDSPKRPEGYWVLGSKEEKGIMTSIFVSDEWLDNVPKEIREQKTSEWGIQS